VVEMLDAYTNVFAAPGTRTTGTAARDYVVVGPRRSDRPTPPALARLDAPTDAVWVVARVLPLDSTDAVARDIQDGLALWPLDAWTAGAPPEPAADAGDGRPLSATPPAVVAAMDDGTFFRTASRLAAENPPRRRDSVAARDLCVVVAAMAGDRRDGRSRAVAADAMERIARHNGHTPCVPLSNGWHVGLCGIGDFGTDYLLRAKTAFYLLGANLPTDALYAGACLDSAGEPLMGDCRYVVRFGPGLLPPARAFWSATVYDADGYLIANPDRKYAVGNRDPLCHEPDGSVPLFIQRYPPDDFWRANWLPAPSGGAPFNLALRLYWPYAAALDGAWAPPPVERL